MGMKQFDHPYLLTMGADNGGWVRYQILPADMYGHRVNLVYHYIDVNPNEKPLKIDSGDYHCINCGLMGSEETMERYTCVPQETYGSSLEPTRDSLSKSSS